MKITYQNRYFVSEENKLSFKQEKENKFFYFDVVFYTDKFIEYQKNLFNEFYSWVLDLADKNENFLDFKKWIENYIKQFNTQLKVFQEKINLDTKIEIRWSLQIIWDENYLSSLIWESSIVIYRKEKLEVVIPNEVEEDDKIDIFSEIVEWELEDNDLIVSIGTNIYNYLTDSEIKQLYGEDILTTLEEILIARIEKQEIWFISVLKIKFENIIHQIKEKNNFKLWDYKEKLKKYKYVIGISLWLIVIIFILIALFSYLGNTPEKQVVEIWDKKVQLDINQLKRDIDAFSKLSSKNTAEKKQQYEKIMQELNAYEQLWIQTLEINELKKKMEQNYYKWFNINIVSENDGLLVPVYSFTKDQIEAFSGLEGIVKTSYYLNVYGQKASLIGLVDKKTKWILQRVSLPSTIKVCSSNLAWNGLYCALSNDDIYNFSKYGIKPLVNTEKSWPKNIQDLGIYWVNKLYTLTLDKEENKKWVFIKRYLLKWWNKFSSPTDYVFSEKNDKKLINAIYTGSSFAIDGTFLIWSKVGLLQAFRKSLYDSKLYIREVPGWKQAIIDDKNDFSWKVKVISYPNWKYVYLYDYDTNSLVVYLTSPYKTNSSATNSYNLIYKFKVKFDLTNEKVIDVVVDENTSSNKKFVYLLTNKWIYKIDLLQFME